jgi:hypothetical protein
MCTYSDFWIDENGIGAVRLPQPNTRQKKKSVTCADGAREHGGKTSSRDTSRLFDHSNAYLLLLERINDA